jgi:hypothetical protein
MTREVPGGRPALWTLNALPCPLGAVDDPVDAPPCLVRAVDAPAMCAAGPDSRLWTIR